MLHPLVELVGFPASHKGLTADQVCKVNAFIEGHDASAGLLAVKVYPNLDTTSEEDIPSGMSAYYDPSGKVDMSSIGDSLFQLVAVSRILTPVKGETYTLKDEYFADKLAALQSAVDQFPAAPANGSEQMLHPKTLREMQQWAPELGGPGSFVGIYSRMRDGDHRVKDYYIAARGTVPLVVQDLKKSIGARWASSSSSVPTYRDLLISTSPSSIGARVAHGAEASRRNIARVLSNVAEACGVAITRADDIDAKLPHVDCAPPEKALPDWEQATHSIRSAAFNGRAAVMICYGVVPAETCLTLKDRQFFVVGNAYDGIALFNLSKHEAVLAAGAVPSDTGRSGTGLPAISAEIAAIRSEAVAWDGKTANLNADLHPQAFKSVIGAEFKAGFKQFGWNAEEHPVERMIPVIAKIYNPELRR
jgi:hypothetical protein